MHHQTTRALLDLNKKEKTAQRSAIQYLRWKCDFEDLSEVFKRFDHREPIGKTLMGTTLAQNWSQVWAPYAGPDIKNSNRSIGWLLAIFKHYAKELERHVVIRDQVETAIMRGAWLEVTDALKTHDSEFGPTMWALRWTLFVAEETLGPREKREVLDLFTDRDSVGSLGYFARVFAISVDKGIPEERFRSVMSDLFLRNNKSSGQFSELLFVEEISEKWESWEVLQHFYEIPLIDRYELFIRLAIIAVANEHKDAQAFARSVSRLSKFTNDAQMRFVDDCLSPKEVFLKETATSAFQVGLDAYMSADYEKCFQSTQALTSGTPVFLPPYELHVKAALFLKIEDKLASAKPSDLILYHMRNIYAKNELAEDSLTFLQRLASRLRVITISRPLKALYAQHSSMESNDSLHKEAAYAMGIHAPRNFEHSSSAAENLRYLERGTKSYPSSLSFKFFYILAQGKSVWSDSELDTIPPVRKHFFEGLALARSKKYRESASSLQEFISHQCNDSGNPLSPFAIEEAHKTLVNSYLATGNIGKMQNLIVESILLRAQSVRRLPMRRAYDSCNGDIHEASRYIGFPIIAYHTSDDPHEVSIALKRFLRDKAVRVPSDLFSCSEIPKQKLALLFLRVCTPEVLDSVEDLDSVEKVQAQRLQLLAWVCSNSSEFERAAETEILKLTQNTQLQEAINNLEGARVVLDPAALREAESVSFGDAYYRYVIETELVRASSKGEIKNALDASRNGGGAIGYISGETLLKNRNDGISAFINAFNQVRDGFLSSPHFGLEACLSGSIRHGFLTQYIRKPFVEKSLAVKNDPLERDQIEKIWLSRLGCTLDDLNASDIMPVLYALTEQIDGIAEEMRESRIQSRTDNLNQTALFDYSFSSDELTRLLNERIKDAQNMDEFLDHIFEVLLVRTKDNLSSVRKHIKKTLREDLIRSIDEATARIVGITINGDLSALRNHIIECRQETERNCSRMEKWFEVSDATIMVDATFELVAQTAVGMIEILNPPFKGKHAIHVMSEYRLAGRHFRSLVRVLFYLLDNAIKYANVQNDLFESSVSITSGSNALNVTVTNCMGSEEAASAAAEIIQIKVQALQASLDPVKVITEGGTGFAKILAAVRYEFKQSGAGIDIGANAEGNLLSVTLKCRMEGIAK